MSKKVLVIDDDDLFRLIIGRTITKMGFQVVENSTGIGVKEQIQTEMPIICLLDMVLDDQDSKEIFLGLKDLPQSPKIIAVSANSDYLDEIERIGIDAVLCKPITPAMLLDTFQKLGITP